MTHSENARTSKDATASGEKYEPFVGRWSRLIAQELIPWLAVPRSGRWLDVGCGTGALCQAILNGASPVDVTGIDPLEDFVTYCQETIHDPRAHFKVGDGQALSFPNRWFDSAVSGLVLNFVPDKGRTIHEMGRVTQSGGTVGLYVWDYAGEMQMLRIFWDAAVALDPSATELHEGRRFPVCRPGTLEDLFAAEGLQSVEVRAIDAPAHFANFDEYWRPFTLGTPFPAPSYVGSLSANRRDALRDAVHSRLPLGADGSIDLIARAWAVKGIVP